jgi:hypothetical protein
LEKVVKIPRYKIVDSVDPRVFILKTLLDAGFDINKPYEQEEESMIDCFFIYRQKETHEIL